MTFTSVYGFAASHHATKEGRSCESSGPTVFVARCGFTNMGRAGDGRCPRCSPSRLPACLLIHMAPSPAPSLSPNFDLPAASRQVPPSPSNSELVRRNPHSFPLRTWLAITSHQDHRLHQPARIFGHCCLHATCIQVSVAAHGRDLLYRIPRPVASHLFKSSMPRPTLPHHPVSVSLGRSATKARTSHCQRAPPSFLPDLYLFTLRIRHRTLHKTGSSLESPT